VSHSSFLVYIAVDCMSGDRGLAATIPAAVKFVEDNKDVKLFLVGDEPKIRLALQKQKVLSGPGGSLPASLEIRKATEVVTMDDTLDVALRRKKDSSMRVAVETLQKDKTGLSIADACVSAGNTGALMAISHYLLKTLPGIDRPAIAAQLPNSKGGATTVLDLGANVDCTAQHLLQFAVMGAALAQTQILTENGNGCPNPSVGLLNVGSETIKGNAVVKQAAELLKTSGLNFYGNVEGDDIFKGTTDVVVCDGFVGGVESRRGRGKHAGENGA